MEILLLSHFFAKDVTGVSIHVSHLFTKFNTFFNIQSRNQHEIKWKSSRQRRLISKTVL
jgi:hypothetical protein